MPFTFSHPAAIIPFTYLPKKWISLTGLIVGSVIPDFVYFTGLGFSSEISHSVRGIFSINFPMAIVVAFTYHLLVRDALIMHLPYVLKCRFLVFTGFDWCQYVKNNPIVVFFSVLIGILSHLMWDSFTQEQGFFVKQWPLLQADIPMFWGQIKMFRVFQHISTILGGVVVMVSIFRFERDEKVIRSEHLWRYWGVFLLIVMLFVGFKFLMGLNYHHFSAMVAAVTGGMMYAFVLTSFFIKKKG
jgi:hypothetical protein